MSVEYKRVCVTMDALNKLAREGWRVKQVIAAPRDIGAPAHCLLVRDRSASPGMEKRGPGRPKKAETQ